MDSPSSELRNDFLRRLSQARAGAPESLGQLLMSCRNYLLLTVGRNLGADLRSKVNPSDIVQETFLEAQRDFVRFHGDTEDELRAWLYRILLNNLANVGRHYRDAEKREVGREIQLPDRAREGEAVGELIRDTPTPSEWMAIQEEVAALECAMSELPEKYQQVLRFRYQEQQTFADIGTRLNCSAEAARKLWARAVDQLQKKLRATHEPGRR